MEAVGASARMPISEVLEGFPKLAELFPLERFLTAVFDALQGLDEPGPAACYLEDSGLLAQPRNGTVSFERAATGVAEILREAAARGSTLRASCLWPEESGRQTDPHPELRSLACDLLDRRLGYLLAPPRALDDPQASALALITAYYLHRHLIEEAIERQLGTRLVIMGISPAIFRIQEDLERYARLQEPVLILGESGSGKEVFAGALHVLSSRKRGPFVAVNCAAAPSENLLLDEFFGHRQGAFSGATFEKEGCCQQADRGTLFLDEIGDMSHELQTLLLRTLATGEVKRIGDSKPRRVDFRLVSATHNDLLASARERRFREDLYYRISAFQIRIPPLRERPADIRHLAPYILWRFAHDNGLPEKRLVPGALARMAEHHWPGNIRELENVLKRAFVVAPGAVIEASHLEFDLAERLAPVGTEELLAEIAQGRAEFWSAVARPFIRRELTRGQVADFLAHGSERCGGRLKKLAEYLNLSPQDYPRFVAFLHRHRFRD